LPSPTILQGDDYFNALLYTGNGSTQTITGSDFQPDLVWVKERSSTSSHALADAVRGAGAHILSTNTNAAEDTSNANIITAFTSTGFSVGVNNQTNEPGDTYVAWNWKANGVGSSNVAGTITSTVSVNTTAGFSIVTYTGNGSGGATIGHGLGIAPSMVIVKRRDAIDDWSCYHVSLGGTKYIDLNSTAAAGTSIVLWNNTNPSSTVVTLGTSNRINGSSATYVAYCFAAVPGYSAFGSYTGNGSADGAFVYTGFRPKFVMLRSTSNLREWFMVDTSRSTYNVVNTYLRANTSSAEGTDTINDILSNGFKLRNSDTAFNGSGETYIYMAFAENPFKNALAR
jgi:hypothetical protein